MGALYTAWLCDGEGCTSAALAEGNDAVLLAEEMARIRSVTPPFMIEVRRSDLGPPLLSARADYYRVKFDLNFRGKSAGHGKG